MREYSIKTVQQVGPVLRGFRKEQRLTQSEVGAKAAIPQPVISRIEADPSGTGLSHFFKILAALDLELILRKRKPADRSSNW